MIRLFHHQLVEIYLLLEFSRSFFFSTQTHHRTSFAMQTLHAFVLFVYILFAQSGEFGGKPT